MYALPLVLTAVLAASVDLEQSLRESEVCAGHARAVVVDVANRTLSLCDDGEARRAFPVAMGTGGIGKRRQGDHRTPLGSYLLGAPRRSLDYGIFIPVGYPTPRQVKMGFTGTAVGIHGPPRAFVNAGRSNTEVDWTWGCIAVASDPEIQAIAAFVNARARTWVHILSAETPPHDLRR